MIRRPRRSVLLAVIAAILLPVVGRAQDNPHGNPDLDCATCHVEASWRIKGKPARFDHATTGFALTGRHADVQCRSCHSDLVFSHVGTSCVDCHADAHRGRLGPDCLHCHATTGWNDRERMRHLHDGTAMPLVGVHERVDCEACHRGAVGEDYVGTPTDCYACHAAQYAATTSPSHAASGLGTDCRECHGVFATSWGAGDFRHPASFPLVGGHSGVDCTRCHADGFAGTPTDCYACHQTDYEQTTDPQHLAAGFATDCASCHTVTAWQPATFDHDATAFRLTGAHRTVDCTACHASGYAGTPTDCFACHESDYQQTTDPSHVASNFPTDCTVCHTTTAWQPANFNHDATAFPLTGAHRAVECASCHTSGYTGTPTDCYACHQNDYQQTSDPPHASSNFPTDCTVCHTTTAWQPADFNHDATAFPLTGAHTTVDCASCHASGYSGTPTDCYACHQNDYQQTSDPPHASSGFPATCADCHTTTAWQPANWDHDSLFPIYSGRHNGTWTSCTECHTVPADYSVFECILCHEHNQSDTDQHHQGVNGYQYLSTACYQCHPRGTGG